MLTFRAPSNRNPIDASANNNENPSADVPIRDQQPHRWTRLIGNLNFRRCDGQWHRSADNQNAASFDDATPASNPPTVFVSQDTRPVVNVEQPQPAISPEILMYEPYTGVQPPTNAEASNVRDGAQAPGAPPFSAVNPPTVGAQAHASARHGTRCPFYRRVSMSGYHNLPNHYHAPLQNGNSYLRPAYAPHESLWYRQQNNQEMHRRHMMNSMSGNNVTNDNTTSNSFGVYPNRGATSISNSAFCLQCDQQHPIGHPHRRMRQYVCGMNLVRSGQNFYFI